MFLPLFFKTGFSCLIVGGGHIASHKIKVLMEMPGNITVIAPLISDYVKGEVRKQSVLWMEREYIDGDCKGFQLVIAATSIKELNRRISEEAQRSGIPINVVDDPELSTVIFPAVWREKSLSVAISTDGVAPFMAAEIRTRLARYARGMGQWVETGGRFRETVKREIVTPEERNALYRRFLDAGLPGEQNAPQSVGNLDDWLAWLENIEKSHG